MENKTIFLKVFGETPLIKTLDFFLDNQEWDYTKKQIFIEAGVSRVTLDNIIPDLLKLGFIKKTRTVGKSTFYQINKESIITQNLIQLDTNLSLNQFPEVRIHQKEKVLA